LFVVKNIDEFKSNFEVHSINTHHRSDLYPPSIKLTKFHKGVYYSGIKIFIHLPQSIKNLSWNVKKFKLALKRFFWWVHFVHLMNILTETLWVILVIYNWYFFIFIIIYYNFKYIFYIYSLLFIIGYLKLFMFNNLRGIVRYHGN
jgi:hypothetical protein